MSVQFDWQVGSDEGRWETLASRRGGPRLNWRWWAWVVFVLVISGAAVGGYLLLRRRYAEAARMAEFQIQSVIDVEARAFARGDEERYLEQQDITAPEWFRRQRLRIQPNCPSLLDQDQARRAYCAAALPAEVVSLDLQGDIAWVEVLEGDPRVRRMRFYRRTATGWKHTAPQPEFWRDERETYYGRATARYHTRDRPTIDPLLDRISRAQHDVCEAIYCPNLIELEVIFAIDAPPYAEPQLMSDPWPQGEDTLFLSSPWLAGIPGDETPEFTEEVYWVTYALASRAIKATTGQPLNLLQEAVIVEYAHWYATDDTELAPILGRIVAHNGTDALQEAFRTLRTADSLDAFVSFWLAISSIEEPETYFETLLRVERDALAVGRQDTFVLLQDNRQPWWVEEQQERFVRFQRESAARLPEVQVQAVEVDGDLATVTLETTSVSLPYLPTVLYYRLRGQEWLHTSAVLAGR